MSDQIMFPLSDWTERIAERGRGSGNLIKERFVFACDNRGFIIGIENAKGVIQPGAKYSSKIEHAVPTARSMSGMDQRQIFDLLCDSMTERGHSRYVYDSSKNLQQNLVAADRAINPWGLFPGKEYVGI